MGRDEINKVNVQNANPNKTIKSEDTIKNINSCSGVCLIFPDSIKRQMLAGKKPIFLTIQNNSDKTIITGDYYEIFKKNSNDKWTKVELEGLIADVGYRILPKSKADLEMPTFFIRNISVGRYKIIKRALEMPDKKRIYMDAEFIITN